MGTVSLPCYHGWMHGNSMDRFPGQSSAENTAESLLSLVEGEVGELNGLVESIESATTFLASLSFPASSSGGLSKHDLTGSIGPNVERALELMKSINANTNQLPKSLAGLPQDASNERINDVVSIAASLQQRLVASLEKLKDAN